MKKDIEFFFKKIFFSQSYLLKKRIKRAIKNNYEKELELIDQFTDKSKDALDIGVYRGVYSYKLSKHFRTVHSFEPNPLLYPYLEKNLKKIIRNIKLYNYALSDINGIAELKLPKRSKSFFKDNIEEIYQLGAATIHKNNEFVEYKKISVTTKKLDDLFNSVHNKIGFIKIDVEGHEQEVINGSREIIRKNKPILLIEIEKRHSKRSVKDTISIINSFGYNCFFTEKKDLIPVDRLKNTELNNNYFFLPI